MIPIHKALKFNAPKKLIEALVHAYPKSMRELDDKGRLPLHHACNLKIPWAPAVVSMLLVAFPGAASIKGSLGMIPRVVTM